MAPVWALFNPLQSWRIFLPDLNRPEEGPRVDNFLTELKQRMTQLPGVQAVAVSNGLPFEGANFPPLVLEGKPAPPPGQDPMGLLLHREFRLL